MAKPKSLVWLAVTAAMSLTVPSFAHAEGSAAEEGAVKAKPRKAKAKPKPKAAAKIASKPTGPVPYNALTPDIQKALTPPQAVTPGPASHAMTPDSLPQPVETNRPIAPASDTAIVPKVTLPSPPSPPPPPVTAALPPVAPTVSARAEISLRCETTVTQGKRKITTGVFFIDLFPSAVFPDQTADFKFLFVDPAHKSLIRGSICLDTMCSANVTSSAYYLVNRVSKKGAALRITLDRSRGAFYAEEIDQGMFGLFAKQGEGDHMGESGTCVPQALPNALF